MTPDVDFLAAGLDGGAYWGERADEDFLAAAGMEAHPARTCRGVPMGAVVHAEIGAGLFEGGLEDGKNRYVYLFYEVLLISRQEVLDSVDGPLSQPDRRCRGLFLGGCEGLRFRCRRRRLG